MKQTLLPLLLLPLSYLPLAADGGFYGDPPDETHPWGVHDPNRPQPPRVEPGTFSSQEQPGKPPSDAVILFDGTEATLPNWLSDKNQGQPTDWIVKDGALQCVPGSGYIRTKEEFGDCQLHIEWSAPKEVQGDSQGRGNSGVFLMGKVEVQVLDNYENPTYADGFAGSVYGVNPPMANPLQAPGAWQTYDIVFRRPVYDGEKMIDPGYVTVFVNGVLVQDHTPLEGGTGHKGRTKAGPLPEKGPLKLQDHGNPVRFRNIWYRPLPKRSSEGGTDGQLSPEATKAKRAEIAATLREEAKALQGLDQLLKSMESLVYASDEATWESVGKTAGTFVSDIAAMDKPGKESKKGDVMRLRNAVKYMAQHQLLPPDFAPATAMEDIVKEMGWDEKK